MLPLADIRPLLDMVFVKVSIKEISPPGRWEIGTMHVAFDQTIIAESGYDGQLMPFGYEQINTMN